jgi:hypothetical protein
MGTSSLTWIYGNNGKLILIMYRQYDGYVEGHGYELACFLDSYLSKYKYDFVDMSKLSGELLSHFQKNEGEYVCLVPMDDRYYWCHDYQYHIFYDKVKIVGLDKDVELNWKSYEFMNFCKFSAEENEEEEEEKNEEEEEENEEEEEEENEEEEEENEEEEEEEKIGYDDFGKVDWEKWENEKNDNFGKVDWEKFKILEENSKSLENWIKPLEGRSKRFKYDGVLYFRDSEDNIWSNKNDLHHRIVGKFDNEMCIIDTNIEYSECFYKDCDECDL